MENQITGPGSYHFLPGGPEGGSLFVGGVKFFWGGLRGGQNFFDGPKGRLIFYGSKGANFFFQEGGLLFGGGGVQFFLGGT